MLEPCGIPLEVSFVRPNCNRALPREMGEHNAEARPATEWRSYSRASIESANLASQFSLHSLQVANPYHSRTQKVVILDGAIEA